MSPESVVTVQHIPCSAIVPGSNDRTVFDAVKLAELADSIRINGLAQPITVRPIGEQFEIVAGERRFRAISQVLQWDTVPALVRDLSDEEAAAIMLTENTGRIDLDPVSEARAYQTRLDKFGWDTKKISETAGVSQERVKSRLSLLKLAEDIQHYVKTGAFPIGHALLLPDLDKNRQRIALRIFGAAKYMPLARFQEIVADLRTQQMSETQLDMFASMLVSQVANEVLVRRGKKARTGAPISRKLPPVKCGAKDNTGDILDRYISELIQQGHDDAAAAIGTVYNALVARSIVSIPAQSILAKTASDDQIAGDALAEELAQS